MLSVIGEDRRQEGDMTTTNDPRAPDVRFGQVTRLRR